MAAKTDAKTKKVKNAVVAPSKKTMNFARHESSVNPKRVLIVAAIIVVIAAVFVKIGILDQLDQKSQAYRELGELQDRHSSIQLKLSKMEELEQQYGRYSYGWMNENEVSMVSRMEALGLIEREVFPHATVENLAINYNTMTMELHGITLEEASDIVTSAEKDPLVSRAFVYTAVSEDAEEAYIAMTIFLTKEVAE